MPSVNQSLLVPYSPLEMFELVDRVEDYPEFLPWCSTSTVHNRDEDEVHASLELSGVGISKSFTTKNLLQKGKMIEIRLINGPLKHLEGFWRFEKVEGEKCRVSLDLDFEIGGGLLDMVVGPLFHQAANTLVDAFFERAKVVYGER